MKSQDIRKRYLDFFIEKGHKLVPSSSLVPENDPTTLFTGSGMQPMIPYLLGEPHPEGKKIVDSQTCFRSQDIEEIGDNRHTTFFEMLGNWSLGDYWKEEQLTWFFEFLTSEVGLDPNKLFVTAFEGNNQIPKDEETIKVWQKLFEEKGIEAKVGERIFLYGVKKNWWSRSGVPESMPADEPGGPDSEVFYLFDHIEHDKKFGENCHPNCDCGRFLEIGNSVFMQYVKQEDGSFKELPQKNVDFGGGLERITAVSIKEPDVFKTDLFFPVIEELEKETGKNYKDYPQIFRVVADHLKAATFLIKDGIIPCNKQQGYVLRRLLRRAAIKLSNLDLDFVDTLANLSSVVINMYQNTDYFDYRKDKLNSYSAKETIKQVIKDELEKFEKTIQQGLKKLDAYLKQNPIINGFHAFDLYQSDGFPPELTIEYVLQKNIGISANFWDEFENAKNTHSELSRKISAGMFKGGLEDSKEQTTKLHTANHLLQAALRKVLGNHLGQRGSNITTERLRFDFNYNEKLTDGQIKEVEDLVNQKIKEDLPVHFDIEEKEEAIKNGALANYGENYPNNVKVYKVGTEHNYFSKELCGGPHVEHTGVLGRFKVLKQESLGSGLRRIYAVIEQAV